MKYLIIAVAIAIVTSCSPEEVSNTIVDTRVDLAVKDGQGNDLLDPSNRGSFNENEIKILYVVNGAEIEFNKGHLDYPKGFFIYAYENEFRIAIFANAEKSEAFPLTYIQWNSTDRDTIKCAIERTSNATRCTKVWLNEKEVWDAYASDRFIRIVK